MEIRLRGKVRGRDQHGVERGFRFWNILKVHEPGLHSWLWVEKMGGAGGSGSGLRCRIRDAETMWDLGRGGAGSQLWALGLRCLPRRR